MESPICIDIVHDECTTRLKLCPGSIQFEAYIAFTVHAVVDKKFDLSKLRKQLGQVQPAQAVDVSPPVCKLVRNCQTHLLLPSLLNWREIDTPEMTFFVPLQCLQNKTRGDAVSHTRLDYVFRPQITYQTPNR